ncbi:MAG: aspartate 1-decarboxylase [Candidatus Binataceae bacterium]
MATRNLLRAKLHRLHLTGANVDYNGSIAIDSDLLGAAGILEYELVHVWNATNGERLETYAISAAAGSGEVCLNGAAALKGAPGDIVIIAAFGQMDEAEARRHEPTVVYVDAHNRIKRPAIAVAG